VAEGAKAEIMALPYPPCRLEILKYPRRAHYSLESWVVRDGPAGLMLYTPAGTPIYCSKRRATFPTSHQIVHFFWPGRHYNAEVFWNPEWRFRGYYLNLALPYAWDGKLCTYTDLELDISHFEGEEIRILDRDEYKEMRERHGLPDSLAAEVERATREGWELLEQGVYPFDGSLPGWRPCEEQLKLS
jgi:protein associated with RNAse G/E